MENGSEKASVGGNERLPDPTIGILGAQATVVDSNTQRPPAGRSTNKFMGVLIILVLLGILGVGYFYLVGSNNQIATSTATTHQTLLETSRDYKEAEDLKDKRVYRQAVEKYTAALSDADSLSKEVLIRLKIAAALGYAGDHLKAVEIFRNIADNPKYTSDVHEVKQAKTIAIVGLHGIFYKTHDKAITEKIFSGKPYEDFIKKEDAGDIDIAYRRLLEYGVSLSFPPPDILAEANIVRWYAVKVYRLKTKGKISEEEERQIKEYETLAKSKLSYIQNNADDARNYYQNSKTISLPIVLRLTGIAAGSLTAAGDTSLGDPEELFLRALSLPQPPWVKSVTKYTYAVFLAAAYGEKRAQDIADLLSDFYVSSAGTELDWPTWLLNEKDYPTANQESLRLLASIDPKFKAFLASLGWEF